MGFGNCKSRFENYGEFALYVKHDVAMAVVEGEISATPAERENAKQDAAEIVAVMRDRGELNWPESD